MLIDKKGLDTYLSSVPLLTAEKEMWHELGFYVAANSSNVVGIEKTIIIDSRGSEVLLPPTFARNIRMVCLERWEGKLSKTVEEKKKSDAVQVDELEITRQT